MSKYKAPNLDGMSTFRLSCADIMVRYTDDPKRPLSLIMPGAEVPLFMEAMDELWRVLGSAGRRIQQAGERSGVCVFADHPSDCQCGSKVPG